MNLVIVTNREHSTTRIPTFAEGQYSGPIIFAACLQK